jgi:hypothetical protein
MNLTWRSGSLTSSLYVVDKLLTGARMLDANVADTMSMATSMAGNLADELHIETGPLLDSLISLSAGADDFRPLAHSALAKLKGDFSEPQVDALLRLLVEIHRAGNVHWPTAVDDLILRAEPLRTQWEARGPGLLRCIGLLAPSLVAENAEVLVVMPVSGGGGKAYPLVNRVALEGVLASPLAELPEVVRLGWLLSQLNLDLPVNAEPLSISEALRGGRLATIPLTLWAAEEVELARCTAETVGEAFKHWVGDASRVDTIWSWWLTFRERNPPWNVALAGLSSLLAQQS